MLENDTEDLSEMLSIRITAHFVFWCVCESALGCVSDVETRNAAALTPMSLCLDILTFNFVTAFSIL